MAAPQVLGVVLEKHGIQLFAEAVDIKVLQGDFFALVHHAAQIAESGFDRRSQPHVGKSLRLERNRIVIELVVEKDTGDPVPAQHDPVLFLGIRSALGQRAVAEKHLVVI